MFCKRLNGKYQINMARDISLSSGFTTITNVKLWLICALFCCIISMVVHSGIGELPPENTRLPEPFNSAMCFDKIWTIINDEFWDPNFCGVDWQEVQTRYRPKALSTPDHESFALIINQMLSELKTSHTCYLTKWDTDYYMLQAVFISQALVDFNTSDTSILERIKPGRYSSDANPHRTGIGVVTKNIEDRHFVIAILASSPAEKANIIIGDWLVEVDGKPFHPIRSFQSRTGQELELTIQRGPARSTRQSIKVMPEDRSEKEMFENDSLTNVKILEHKGHHFAYIRLWWLSGWAMRQVLDCGVNASESEGLIIDIRDGLGGGPPEEFIQPFLKDGLETISVESIGRQRKFRSTVGYDKPVIVLINGGSRSGKELLAYYFKKTQRAVLVGERTAGAVNAGSWNRISEDSILYFCRWMLLIDGKRLEGIGVVPDITVPFDMRFAAGKDIQLECAKDEIVKQIESR